MSETLLTPDPADDQDAGVFDVHQYFRLITERWRTIAVVCGLSTVAALVSSMWMPARESRPAASASRPCASTEIRPLWNVEKSTSASEESFLGARHYLDHPLVPLDKVVAAFHFEFLGRPDREGRMLRDILQHPLLGRPRIDVVGEGSRHRRPGCGGTGYRPVQRPDRCRRA